MTAGLAETEDGGMSSELGEPKPSISLFKSRSNDLLVLAGP